MNMSRRNVARAKCCTCTSLLYVTNFLIVCAGHLTVDKIASNLGPNTVKLWIVGLQIVLTPGLYPGPDVCYLIVWKKLKMLGNLTAIAVMSGN